jgi:hypothetical protein
MHLDEPVTCVIRERRSRDLQAQVRDRRALLPVVAWRLGGETGAREAVAQVVERGLRDGHLEGADRQRARGGVGVRGWLLDRRIEGVMPKGSPRRGGASKSLDDPS